MGLGKVWQKLYVCGVGLFSYLTYVHFWNNYAGRYIVDKTSHDKGRAYETVQLDIVGNYPSAGYTQQIKADIL